MIPYYPEPVWRVGPLEIHAFSVLLVAAVLAGFYLAGRRAKRLGIDENLMFQVAFWAIACGLIGAAKVDFAALFAGSPWVALKNTHGIRSQGGLLGGLLGIFIYCRLRKISWLEAFRFLDIIAYALPFAWIFGRLGCALAHDHRGLASDSWIAVQFPEGSRLDLGLIELLFLIGFAACFWWLDRKPRAVGFFLALYGTIYGAFRVWLDTLHIQPLRFYGGMVAFAVGLIAWVVMTRVAGRITSAHKPVNCLAT